MLVETVLLCVAVLQASEEQVTKLQAQLEKQKVELEAAAAAKLEEAEASFTKQLGEMQTLLADYQTQVRCCISCCYSVIDSCLTSLACLCPSSSFVLRTTNV
jgi:hypothetical protein